MSTPSETRLKKIIKKYVQDILYVFKLEQGTGGRSLHTGMLG